VVIQLFIAYAIIKTIAQGDDLDKIMTIFFTFYFTLFLLLGLSFTGGLYAFMPMTEKKGGLRQMMHMSGLTSFQYYAGLFLADILIFTAPSLILCIGLVPFD
jgi:hypothetical protein